MTMHEMEVRRAHLKASYEAVHPILATVIPFEALSRMSWYAPGMTDAEAATDMHALARDVYERANRKCREEFERAAWDAVLAEDVREVLNEGA